LARRVVIGMLVLWLAAILSRNVIRAHWWAHRLAVVESPDERLAYFRRLTNLGETAVPAVSRLLSSDDAGLRSLVVGVLHHAPGDRASNLLLQAARDTDPDVVRLAIQGLAIRRDQKTAQSLASIAASADQRKAMMATAALGNVGSGAAQQALIDLLQSSPHTGVRIEAIDALANLQAQDAVRHLIGALDDEAVFEGLTESDIMASRVFEAAQSSLALPPGSVQGASVHTERRHVVWECAHRALQLITGYTPGSDKPDASDRPVVAKAWHDWLDGTRTDDVSASP
jgi:HEAT repeat protein